MSLNQAPCMLLSAGWFFGTEPVEIIQELFISLEILFRSITLGCSVSNAGPRLGRTKDFINVTSCFFVWRPVV